MSQQCNLYIYIYIYINIKYYNYPRCVSEAGPHQIEQTNAFLTTTAYVATLLICQYCSWLFTRCSIISMRNSAATEFDSVKDVNATPQHNDYTNSNPIRHSTEVPATHEISAKLNDSADLSLKKKLILKFIQRIGKLLPVYRQSFFRSAIWADSIATKNNYYSGCRHRYQELNINTISIKYARTVGLDWLIDCLTARQHRKVNLRQLLLGGKLAQAAKDGQRDTIPLTLHNNNITQFTVMSTFAWDYRTCSLNDLYINTV